MTTEASTSPTRFDRSVKPSAPSRVLPVVLLVATAVVLLGIAVRRPSELGTLVFLGSIGLLVLVVELLSPQVALLGLMLTTSFRLVIPRGQLPDDPFMLAFGLLIVAVAIKIVRGHERYPMIGPLEGVIGLYIAVNVLSMITAHHYAAVHPTDGTSLEVSRFLVIGVVMPLACAVTGIACFGRDRGLRLIVFAVMGFGAYSAFASIMVFYGPESLVFPRFMVSDPGWTGRAVGVFRQPVENGLALILSYLGGVLMASRRTEQWWVRLPSALLAVASLYAVYLTHTRGVWLALGVAVVMGAVMARGWRRWFVATGLLVAVAIVLNWSEFTSKDRSAGGVGSTSELEDRLNMIATARWAVNHEPWFGWGLGRFAVVNTYHHQQAAPNVPWARGYGISSHVDVLGIAAELGLLGVACYLAVLAVLAYQLLQAVRVLPLWNTFAGQVAVLAAMFLACWVVIGLTVDMRFFDFPNIAVMVLAGAVIGCLRRAPRIDT